MPDRMRHFQHQFGHIDGLRRLTSATELCVTDRR